MSEDHAGRSPLAASLVPMSHQERFSTVRTIVVTETAALLGWDPDEVDPDRAYAEYGYNSLAAVELTSQLSRACGIELALTLLFDYPTPTAVAECLLELLGFPKEAVAAPADTGTSAGSSPGEDDPIAVVGMACRYPGGVDSADGLWELVAAGRDAVTGFPTDRGWDLAGLFDEDPDHPGTSYVRYGGFIDDVAGFDAEFFGISPREAQAMDPQQRLLLETAWQAVEDAGIDPMSLQGSRTGVFVGLSTYDYAYLARSGPAELEGFWGIGTAGAVASGRLAYALGLVGPALTVDTACSSSLVSLHLAAQSLRRGESSLALAGGAAVLATPTMFVEFSRQRGLAPDGRCKSFAAAADGTGWSEGVGLLVLERLSDARRNGHHVYGLLRGSAVNQDGASNGLTAPNGPSQQRVLRDALTDAGLSPHDIDAIEAHGTGTTLGDPIEAQALLAVFGPDRPAGNPLRLGSLKSNIGHSQAAAGVGGVIKMLQALHHQQLPATLHVDRPTPNVDWTSQAISLLTAPTPWPANPDHPRRAGVSAFGVGGTNAHVIIEEPPVAEAAERAEENPAILAWPLSAKTPQALRDQATSLLHHLTTHPTLSPAAVATTLATRTPFAHRAVVTGHSRTDLITGLEAIRVGRASESVVRGEATRPGKLAFVFPGEGSQWQGMALDLLDESPVFAQALQDCAEALQPHLDWSVLDVLRGDPAAPELGRVDVTPSVLFAVMVSLAELWRSYGVRPDGVIGFSQGEISAARACGALSLPDAATIVARRSKLSALLSGTGGMTSVVEPVAAVTERLTRWPGRLHVANVSSPHYTVVGGELDALAELHASCDADGVRYRSIPVHYASHTPFVEPIREELLDALADLTAERGPVDFYSTVTGQRFDQTELAAEYWYRNLRLPVLAGPTLEAMAADGFTTFLELSPHSTAGLIIADTLADANLVPTLSRDEAGLSRVVRSLAHVWVSGFDVAWNQVCPPGQTVSLPGYAYSRRRFWVTPREAAQDLGTSGLQAAAHPFLRAATSLAGSDGWLFTGRVSTQAHPWLVDHAVFGSVLLPGTAFVDMALWVGARIGCTVVDELTLQAPLILPAERGVLLQVRVGEQDQDGRRPISVHGRGEDEDEGWTLHASGMLAPDAASGLPAAAGLPGVLTPPAVTDAGSEIYQRLEARGFDYGPAFQCLQHAWTAEAGDYAEVRLGELTPDADGFAIHPALLDAAFHSMVAQLDGEEVWLPFSWNGVQLRSSGASSLRARLSSHSPEAVGMVAADEHGAPVVSVDSVVARPVSVRQLAAATRVPVAGAVFTVEWRPADPGPAPEQPSRWVRVSGSGDELFELPADSYPTVDDAAAAAAGVVVAAILPDRSEPESVQVRRSTSEVLALLQAWSSDERSPGSRLVLLTRHAVASTAGVAPDPVAAAVWGLVRSAQSENPGQFVLIDVEDSGVAADQAAGFAQALASGEPQVALHGGAVLVPRLVATGSGELAAAGEAGEADSPAPFGGGTVLITGGTSGLGLMMARHLVLERGVRHLLLLSRRGPDAPAIEEARAELSSAGAQVAVLACDVADRDQLRTALATIDPAHPLTAVIHAAGVLDDGVITSVTPERLDGVLRPKVDAVLALADVTADVTADAELAEFIVLSSIAGVVGGPGQGAYAAANAFLDAFVQRRRAQGLPARSQVWGLWQEATDMAKDLDALDLARLKRSGMTAFTARDGLQVFDAALALPDPVLVLARLDLRSLKARARDGELPAMLRGLVPVAASAPGSHAAGLADRLAGLEPAARPGAVLEAVLAAVAVVLGHQPGTSVDPDRPFKELGFDSLVGLQLRQRLVAETGLPLPATLAFDHPTSTAVADYLVGLLVPALDAGPSLDERLDQVTAELSSLDPGEHDRIAVRLRVLLGLLGTAESDSAPDVDRIEASSAQEIFDLIDNDLNVR
jgi:acyl transferase domain-containing protein/NADP-dependent 3-hydroxy acid dehydrogenase YdfG/acyl carrier protein